MNEIGPVSRRDAAEHTVKSDNDRHQRHQHIFRFHPEQFLAHEWHGHLADGGKQHRTVHHVIETTEDGVRHPNGLGFIAFHKPIAQREAAHAAIPYGADPVNGRDAQPVHDPPHPAHAVEERAARRGHWVGRASARAERGKRLHQLAETAAGHEKILLLFLATHEPKTNSRHPGEVEEQNKKINQLQFHETKQRFG